MKKRDPVSVRSMLSAGSRPSLAELEMRAQKPDHRHVGNWWARTVIRPAALRITWLVLPWGLSATQATLLAWGAAGASVACFASGWWLVAAGLLQLWYLLDHVDGQLARYRGQASLDGVHLDYLMHHSVNLVLPLTIGYGLSNAFGYDGWLLAGSGWAMGLTMVHVFHDARYKAFFQRLKRLQGELLVHGGGGGKPTRPAALPTKSLHLASWVAKKSCEVHVIMHMLTLLAVIWTIFPQAVGVTAWYVGGSAVTSLAIAVALVARGYGRAASEAEFAAWFSCPDGYALHLAAGWSHVERVEAAEPPPLTLDDDALGRKALAASS